MELGQKHARPGSHGNLSSLLPETPGNASLSNIGDLYFGVSASFFSGPYLNELTQTDTLTHRHVKLPEPVSA